MKSDCEVKEELSVKSEIDSDSKSKCGEVFVTKLGQISCYCVICQQNFENINNFTNHILIDHLELKSTQEANSNVQVKNAFHPNYENLPNPENTTLQRFSSSESINSIPFQTIDEDSYNGTDDLESLGNNEINYKSKEKNDHGIEPNHQLDIDFGTPQKRKWTRPKNSDVKLFHCDVCQRAFQREGALENHKKNHEKKLIDCPHCGKCFQKLSLFKTHNLERCADKQKKVLDTSNTTSTSTTTENQEAEIKSEICEEESVKEEKYKCKLCFKSYSSLAFLKNHKKKHEENAINCEKCGQKFWTKKHRKTHMNSVHPDWVNEETNADKKCRNCPRVFQKWVNLKKHEERHNKIDKCEYCGKLFENQKAKYEQHLRSHTGEKPFKCPECPSAFSTRGNLNHHKSTCHSEERPYICTWTDCGKGFKKDRQRVWHERIHTGEKPYQCEKCGQYFAFQHKLSLHKKQKHLDKKDRPHKCDQCEKAFVLPRQLREHKYTHTGERPHQCDVCPARFAKRGGLNEHKKLHTGEKKHVCEICGRAFAQRAGYATHIKSHRFL